MEGSGADAAVREPDVWDLCCDNGVNGGGDLGCVYLCPCHGLFEYCNWGVNGGTMASKVYHMATHFCHWTPDGVVCASVTNFSALDSNFVGCK